MKNIFVFFLFLILLADVAPDEGHEVIENVFKILKLRNALKETVFENLGQAEKFKLYLYIKDNTFPGSTFENKFDEFNSMMETLRSNLTLKDTKKVFLHLQENVLKSENKSLDHIIENVRSKNISVSQVASIIQQLLAEPKPTFNEEEEEIVTDRIPIREVPEATTEGYSTQSTNLPTDHAPIPTKKIFNLGSSISHTVDSDPEESKLEQYLQGTSALKAMSENLFGMFTKCIDKLKNVLNLNASHKAARENDKLESVISENLNRDVDTLLKEYTSYFIRNSYLIEGQLSPKIMSLFSGQDSSSEITEISLNSYESRTENMEGERIEEETVGLIGYHHIERIKDVEFKELKSVIELEVPLAFGPVGIAPKKNLAQTPRVQFVQEGKLIIRIDFDHESKLSVKKILLEDVQSYEIKFVQEVNRSFYSHIINAVNRLVRRPQMIEILEDIFTKVLSTNKMFKVFIS